MLHSGRCPKIDPFLLWMRLVGADLFGLEFFGVRKTQEDGFSKRSSSKPKVFSMGLVRPENS